MSNLGRRIGTTLAALACAGCLTHGSDSLRETPFDIPQLVAALRETGATANTGDEIEQPFFTVMGRMVSLAGEDVQVYQYSDEDVARQVAATISPDGGTIGTSRPFWAASPHFYRKGLLIVLYTGDSASVIRPLDGVLGRQFAGR
jgi:hypothetical protein